MSLGICVSGLSEAAGILVQMEMSSFFTGCRHKNWLLKAVTHKKKKKPQEEIKRDEACCSPSLS